jgi:hypothetical protein
MKVIRNPSRRKLAGLTFDTVDAVINWANGKVFFFKGDLYTRYDIKADKADPGYPRRIDAKNWPGLVGAEAIQLDERPSRH